MTSNQFFFKNFVFLPVTFLRGERFYPYLKAMERTQWLSVTELETIQRKKLGILLGRARRDAPYYRNTLGNIPGEPDLDQLPFVTKAILKQNQNQLLSQPGDSRLIRKTTGGSTGQAVTIFKSTTATAQEVAGQWRGFRWAGIDIGHRQGRFWGVPRAKGDRLAARLADWVCNRRRCSAFSFTEQDMVSYTREMNYFKPIYLYGYVSMLARYAEFLMSTDSRVEFRPKAIFTTAEVLTPYHRNLLERVFNARVFNEYGCGEIGTIAHECEQHGMHVNTENMIIEILDGNRRCEPGEVGEIVVTELNNAAMPLIRYRLGDFASWSDQECGCGRGLPVIRNIVGRAYDLVYNKAGEMFHGEFFMYIFEEAKKRELGVQAFKVVQDSVDHFTILIQPGNGYGDATRSLIRERIQSGYGEYAAVDFLEVDQIEREASGKMRLIVGMNSPTYGH